MFVKKHKMAGRGEPRRLDASLRQATDAVQTQAQTAGAYRIRLHDQDGELEGFHHYDHSGEPQVRRNQPKGSI